MTGVRDVKGIRFVCTDKGSHRLILLGVTGYLGNLNTRERDPRAKWRPQYDDSGEWALNAPPRGEAGKRTMDGRSVLSAYVRLADDPSVPILDRGYELLCPKCGRNPQIGRARFEAALVALKAAGITEVDISVLPF